MGRRDASRKRKGALYSRTDLDCPGVPWLASNDLGRDSLTAVHAVEDIRICAICDGFIGVFLQLAIEIYGILRGERRHFFSPVHGDDLDVVGGNILARSAFDQEPVQLCKDVHW